jgi:integrase
MYCKTPQNGASCTYRALTEPSMGTKLTLRTVDAAKPLAKPYELRDGDIKGLLLRVQPSGVKSFVVEWGRGKRTTLGRFPVMTLAAARTQAMTALADAAQHGTPEIAKPRGKVVTLGDLINKEYGPWVKANRKDGEATVARLESTFSEFLTKPLSEVNAWVVEKWRSARLKAGRTPATVNRDLTALKACLSKGVEWELLETHPLTKVKPSKVDTQGRVRYLSPKEDKALRKALHNRDAKMIAERKSGNRWRAERERELLPDIPDDGFGDHLTPMVLLAMNTGLRRGELTSLEWTDIDLRRKQLTVRGGNAKSGKTRHVPLNTEALDVLKRYHRQHKGDGRLFDLTRVNKSFAALLESAGIAELRFHDLRHSFASHLVMAGADLYVVKELLGHASIAMTERYSHLAPGHKAKAVALLGVGTK